MGNEVANRNGGTALSTNMVESLLAGIAESRSSTPLSGGKPILRLLKSGTWAHGQNSREVQEGSEWAINPLSIMHGWSCWSDNPGNQKNELLGEQMTPVTEKKPMRPEPINGQAWAEQRVMDMRCMNGDDEGLEVTYKTSSLGGMKAVDSLLVALIKQLKTDPTSPVAIVQLDVDSYQHVKYGQTFFPILAVVDWISMDGDRGDDQPEPEPKTVLKAAPKAAAKPEPEPEPAIPAAAARASAAPRRQRPAGRV
jgi:hypothetical protein